MLRNRQPEVVVPEQTKVARQQEVVTALAKVVQAQAEVARQLEVVVTVEQRQTRTRGTP